MEKSTDTILLAPSKKPSNDVREDVLKNISIFESTFIFDAISSFVNAESPLIT